MDLLALAYSGAKGSNRTDKWKSMPLFEIEETLLVVLTLGLQIGERIKASEKGLPVISRK